MAEQEKTENAGSQNAADDISLRVIAIPDKEWKEYRTSAPQGELLTLGIGMKLWLEKTRKHALMCFIIPLLAAAIGVPILLSSDTTAGVLTLVIGYITFCALLWKRKAVELSLSQARRSLNSDIRNAFDAEFKTTAGRKFGDAFIGVVLFAIGQPFFIALAGASAAIPSLAYTRLAIPEGYGFEELEKVKRYYAERSFLSEFIIDMIEYNFGHNTPVTLTFKDEYGDSVDVTEQFYTVNGEKVYKDKYGNEYMSDDGGESIHKKQVGE